VVPDLARFGVKLFAAQTPEDVLKRAVPVFHRWIQNHTVPGVLVDVADYGHLPKSPGVVLVTHEANFALDATEGPLGLLYTRKIPLEGTLEARVKAASVVVLEAASQLEGAPEFEGKLRFRTDLLLWLSNDRLSVPNTEDAWAAVRPALTAVFAPLFGEGTSIGREASDPRRRLTVRVTSPSPVGLSMLRARLG
jgi:hypothetical protein